MKERLNKDGLPDALGGMAFGIACVILLLHSYTLPVSTAFFPKIILVISIALSALLTVRGTIKMSKSEDKAKFFKNVRRFSYAIMFTLIYIISVSLLGFFTSTFLFIPAVSYFFGHKNLKRSFIYSAIYCSVIFVVFVLAFDRPLPTEFFLMK